MTELLPTDDSILLCRASASDEEYQSLASTEEGNLTLRKITVARLLSAPLADQIAKSKGFQSVTTELAMRRPEEKIFFLTQIQRDLFQAIRYIILVLEPANNLLNIS